MESDHKNYKQKIEYGRASLWAPFYAVGMAARIQGDIPTGLLEEALRKLQILYPPLASRVCVEPDGTAWLTTEGVGQFSLEVRSKTSDNDWAKTFLEQERVPFAFDCGPVARFFLLRGEQSSDLIVIAPHVVCDGYSMAPVMYDAVSLLNAPQRAVTRPASTPAVTWQTVPASVRDDLRLLRGLARVVNRTWLTGQVILQQAEYEMLHRCYWARQHNGLLTFKLSPAETSDLVARCRQQDASGTGALIAAFLLAQADVRQGELPHAEIGPTRDAAQPARHQVSVAVNIRDRLTQPPGRMVGVYASSVDVTMRTKPKVSFWELARESCTPVRRALTHRSRLFWTLVLEELRPSIADSVVKSVAIDQWSPEFELLAPFVKLREEARCLDISNIGRINLPALGAPYRLETLLPFPPLVPGGGLALNVLTVNDEMNMILKFRQDRLGGTITSIKDRALRYLSGA